jgi:hypothetical protein
MPSRNAAAAVNGLPFTVNAKRSQFFVFGPILSTRVYIKDLKIEDSKLNGGMHFWKLS